MKITAKSKLLSVVLALALVLVLLPFGETGANEPEVEENFGFIPNSWDASVSKVDLVDFEEVARYYTAPRDGVDVRSWRTNRIAMDADGNAWALNTGTDAFRYGPNDGLQGQDDGLQGQVVRIQGDTESLANTHQYPDAVLDFGTDEAVQVFDVGGVDDMPRAIAVDGNGYIWVGFYGSGALMQFEYDGDNLNLVEEFNPDDKTIAYYEMKFAPGGDLFISSRSSTPSISGDFGIYRFDGNDFFAEELFSSPYALLVAPDETVYATSYNNVLRIRDAGGSWSQVTIEGARNLRGLQLDGLGNLWIAETDGASGGNRVYYYNLADATSGFVTLVDSNTPVGVGRDAAGLMWAISRTDNQADGFIEAIDPVTKEVVGSIEVGPRPYAYGDFVVEAPPVEKCYGSETAWAFGDENAQPIWDFVRSNNWGWTNGPLSEGSYEFPVYAGAGQNDIERGTLVGTLHVEYENGAVSVKYELDEGYFLGETHLWVGGEVLPEVRRGNRTEFTNAPGQFPYGGYLGFNAEDLSDAKTEWEWTGSGFEGDIYIAAHAVVWMEVECEE